MENFLPNLFVLGAAKSGSTTLHECLAMHPEVCMADPKEPFFFEAEFDRGLEFFQEEYFPHWQGEPIIGESRHRNLYLPYVPERIHATNPDAKLVVILREPVARAFSHWMMASRNGDEDLDFADAIADDLARIEAGKVMDTPEEEAAHRANLKGRGRRHGLGIYRTYVDTGYYADQIERYLKLFSRKQLHLIILEEFLTDQDHALGELFRFLGVNGDDAVSRADVVANPALPSAFRNEWVRKIAWRWGVAKLVPKGVKRRVSRKAATSVRRKHLTPDVREKLADHFHPHNQRLEALLGRDIKGW